MFRSAFVFVATALIALASASMFIVDPVSYTHLTLPTIYSV